jgi:biopolymer transport protein TolR
MGLSNNSSRQTSTRRRRHQQLSEINVTPLVDVMLVLLIVFMVTAPLMTPGIKVNLPKTSAGPITQADNPLQITVKKDGTVFLQKETLTADALVARLSAIADNGLATKLYLKGDKDASYGTIMKIMGLLSGASYTNIALMTDVTD